MWIKKYLRYIKRFQFAFICVCIFSSNTYSLKIEQLILENGDVTDVVIEILAYTGVRIEGCPVNINWPPEQFRIRSKNLDTIIELTQGRIFDQYNWYNGPLGLRSEVGKKFIQFLSNSQHKDVLIALLTTNLTVNNVKGLSMTAETKPEFANPTHVLLLGTTVQDFQDRVNFFSKLLKDNTITSAPKIFILTGKRELTIPEVNVLTEANDPNAEQAIESKNEKQAMEWVYRTASNHNHLMTFPITVSDDNPTGARATTLSTVLKFFKELAAESDSNLTEPARLLIISSHIFALYQWMITCRGASISEFMGQIDVAAPSYDDTAHNLSVEAKIGYLLDYLSRTLYEIREFKKLNKSFKSITH